MKGTTQDLLDYLDRGERIIDRLAPRVSSLDDGTDDARREYRRLNRNVAKLSEWCNALPVECDTMPEHWGKYWTGAVMLATEQGDVAGHWYDLSVHLMDNAEYVLMHGHGRHPQDGVARARSARYYLSRMRLLAVQGESYSPLLTLDELAADLRANGIRLMEP